MSNTLPRIYKAEGAGNDFAILVGHGDVQPGTMEAAARELCDRHRSIGADGLVWVDTSCMPAVANTLVWNPDGSPVGMCLNAARCVFILLKHLFGVDSVDIRFSAMSIQAGPAPEGARLQFELGSKRHDDAVVSEIGARTWFVDLADPHVIVDWKSGGPIEGAALEEIALAHSSGGGLSTRASNCHLVTHDEGMRHHFIRSFERRVEAETEACGSGCVASYLALSLSGEHSFHTQSGDEIRVARSGGDAWTLEGPARLVFQTDVPVLALDVRRELER